MKIFCRTKKILADLITPVTVYLNLRAKYDNVCMLESNDFRAADQYLSIIAFEPMARIWMKNRKMYREGLGSWDEPKSIRTADELAAHFHNYMNMFEINYVNEKALLNGFIGHTNFDAVQYFDSIRFAAHKRKLDIPDLQYIFFKYLIIFDHFKEEAYIVENVMNESDESQIDVIIKEITSAINDTDTFGCIGDETSNLSDEEFKELVKKGKEHCFLGDVFQIVLSRQYAQAFRGDEFKVYRVLRSINPSPYLFYFDFGSYKIFGSSPEAHLVIEDGMARLNPIAGTYKRTGIDAVDAEKAKELSEDPKEVAEHIMLVDLARNDLGRHCDNVQVKVLKEIQYFSHVIHLVSTVTGDLPPNAQSISVFGDTFPAGTLSGAPKYKAIELINAYENQNRSFYGGAIGYIGFEGDMNQAIMIRSFLSKNNTLYCQAGAGVVSESNEENELQEVNNKLGALKRAMVQASTI